MAITDKIHNTQLVKTMSNWIRYLTSILLVCDVLSQGDL